MRGYLVVLSLVIAVGCSNEEGSTKNKEAGHIYNSSDGIDAECSKISFKELDFTIDEKHIGVIPSGQAVEYYLKEGAHFMKVVFPETDEILEPQHTFYVNGKGWYTGWGCKDGTQPGG